MVKDELGNTGQVVSGGIVYNRYKNWGVDIQMTSDKIMSLNTTKQLNKDFWGMQSVKPRQVLKACSRMLFQWT
ncbi:MAG: hypothetical protein IPH57_05795 [Saprospiraceae bacterium]|nr:hypothetical protein [Saprospiraceae bacterium]